MTRVKREHYVPQFHLREWLVDGQLWVKDLTRDVTFSTGDLTGLLSEKGFYDLAEVDQVLGVFQATEKALGTVETFLGPCAAEARAVVYGTAELTPGLRYKLGVYGALQFFRTKGFREAFTDYLNWRLAETKDQAWAQAGGTGPAPSVVVKDAKQVHVAALHAPERLIQFAKALSEFNLVLYTPTEQRRFMTSDEPAVVFPNGWTGLVPLEVLDHEFPSLGFPLTPDCYCEFRNPQFDNYEPGTYRVMGLQDEAVAIKNAFTILNASDKVIAIENFWPEVEVLREMKLLNSRGLTGGGVVCPLTGIASEGLKANWFELVPRQLEFAQKLRKRLAGL